MPFDLWLELHSPVQFLQAQKLTLWDGNPLSASHSFWNWEGKEAAYGKF